ncbi:BadM/Rrf2 family transcriptional regulator [Shimia isoporae]|uniref:BadM/Rrf2 family transcriptional regulator n=1 Tax=Shimia isoporae TaxID=647720 RepID=A0A4R1NPT1_9RHOB|nr:Rrf2 family transcriptional regulator [Shimia isoporae]TCL10245.1 BadM/Rrf2 family transcriptional regulator [Shimia isoporae]
MRVTTHSDYGLRVLIYVGLANGRMCKIQEIAESYDISRSHLTKVVWKLSEAGFLKTTKGRNGGMVLARAPEEINLGAVLRLMESRTSTVECFGPNNACKITSSCSARSIFREAQEAFFAVFDQYSLRELVARKSDLMRIFEMIE